MSGLGGFGLPLGFQGFGVWHGHDCGHAPAVAGDVRDAAAYGGVVHDFAEPRTQFAHADLITCVRRHPHRVAEVHLGTVVYTNPVGSETSEHNDKPP